MYLKTKEVDIPADLFLIYQKCFLKARILL